MLKSFNHNNNINLRNELSPKERSGLYKLTHLLQENKNKKYILEQTCMVLAEFFNHNKYVNIRIKYGKYKYCNDYKNFVKTKWKIEKSFQTIYQNKGVIEVFHTKEFPVADKGSFTNAEINFLKKATTLITSYFNTLETSFEIDGHKPDYDSFIVKQNERLKELACISNIEDIIKSKKSIDITLQETCYEIRKAMQYPDYTVARILFNDKVYSAPKEFANTKVLYTVWTIRETFDTKSGNGVIVVYSQKEISGNNSPFSEEEEDIVKKVAGIIKEYIDEYKNPLDNLKPESGDLDKKSTSKFILSAKKMFVRNFLHKNNFARDIFHDLMPFKVKEILLFANLYDAFSIEKEGRISDHILGEYYQLNLTSVPRITAVSSFEETYEQLNQKYFDLIIIMSGSDKKTPIELSSSIYKKFGYIPTYLLVNNNTDMSFYQEPKRIKIY